MKPENDDELDASLKRVLSHEPGEEYFADFASRVLSRIAADARAESERAAAARVPWWRALFASPRALAAAGSFAVLALAAGVTFMVMRGPHGSPEEAVTMRALERAPAAAPPPAAKDEAAPEAAPTDTRAAAPSNAIAEGAASAPLAAKPSAPPPASARLQEVRTSESGESVPVPGAAQQRAAERDANRANATPPAAPFAELKSRLQAPAAPAPVMAKAAPPAAAKAEPLGDAAPGQAVVGGEAQSVRRDEPVATTVTEAEKPAREESVGAASGQTRGGETPKLGLTPSPPATSNWGAMRAFTRDKPVDALRPASPFDGEAATLQVRIVDAEAKVTEAKRARRGAAWDAAADAWSALVPALATPAAQVEARWRAADARMQAWRSEPTPARESAAREAARAFVAVAPNDPRVRSLPNPAQPWGQTKATYR